MNVRQKIVYIWDYYRLPLFAVILAACMVCYTGYRHFTDKEILLYVALVNVSVSEDSTDMLSREFVTRLDKNTKKNATELYANLYLTSDSDNEYYEYAYASRMKILAAINAKRLDIVLMNREAFDAFSANGYLADLSILLDSSLYEQRKNSIVSNIIITEYNTEEPSGTDPQYSYMEAPLGIDLTESSFFRQAGFHEPVFLGVLANTPRTDTAIQYIQYLFEKI